MGEIPQAERSATFCALLLLEIELRREQGEQPTAADYHARFPQEASLIQSIFESQGPTGSVSGKEPRTIDEDLRQTMSFIPGAVLLPTGTDDDGAKASGKTLGRSTELSGKRDRTVERPPPTVAGYELLEELGRGGMGVVYKARHLKLRRLVALKMILPGKSVSNEIIERFLAEARAVAQFKHANLVQIHAVGETTNEPFIELELVEGNRLDRHLSGAPQPAAAAAGMVETLARAVDYAHRKGIVHRDLKPSNILMTEEGVLKITDFGLAKHLNEEAAHDEMGRVIGTSSYMAPEQAAGKSDEADERADIYALGVILYEMLTGRPPFKTSDRKSTLYLVRTADPVPPRDLVPQVPSDLELICLKCLKKEPNERFASAAELADELRRIQEGRPILTRPTPIWERAWKWARRERAIASLIAVSAVALLSLVLYLDQRARGARAELAEQQRVGKSRDDVRDFLSQAQAAADREDGLGDAQGFLEGAFAIVKNEPKLAALKLELDALQGKVSTRIREEDRRKKADRDFAEFDRLRDEALFHYGMVRGVVDLPANLARTKKAGADAVTVFDRLPAHRQELCKLGCYELLLIWAEVEAQPDPGRKKVAVAESIRLLNRAAGLNIASQSYHRRRAEYLAIQGGDANDKQLLDEAKEARAQAERTPPAGALDHFLAGDAHEKNGRLPEAKQAFGRALELEPRHFWARYFLALCNLRMQKMEDARSDLTFCLDKKDYWWLHLLRGYVNSQLNDPAAERDLERALKSNPDQDGEYGIRVLRGISRMRQARQVEGAPPLAFSFPLMGGLEMIQGVAEALRRERLKTAAERLIEAEAMDPGKTRYQACRYLSLVRQQQKEWNDADNLINQAIARAGQTDKTTLAGLYGQRARLRREMKDDAGALADLKTALEIAPSADDFAERGRIRHVRREFGMALDDYDAAARLRTTDPEIQRLKAAALMASRGNPAAIVRALDLYRDNGGRMTAEFHLSRAFANGQLKRFLEAQNDYTEAIKLQPNAANYAARAWVSIANNAPQPAIADFDLALKRDPNFAEAYAGRGLARVMLGKHADALADAQAALADETKASPRLLWNIAHIHTQVLVQLGTEPRTYSTRMFHQDKAVGMLEKALAGMNEKEARAFWNQHVEGDRLLDPIRGDNRFRVLHSVHGKLQ